MDEDKRKEMTEALNKIAENIGIFIAASSEVIRNKKHNTEYRKFIKEMRTNLIYLENNIADLYQNVNSII